MKLMFVTPAYRPSFFIGAKGGGEISNQILLEALAQKGFKVYVISMVPVMQEAVYRDGHIRVIEPFSIFKGKALAAILSLVFFKNALSRLVVRVKPDVALSSTSVIKVASEVCKANGVRHGGMVRAMENMPGYGWKWTPRSPASLVKFALHKTTIGWPGGRELDDVDFIVANSEFLKAKYLSEFPGKPACVVYPALAIEKSNKPLPEVIRRVMMVGTSYAKGFDIFKELASKFPDLEFHAIGDRNLQGQETRRDGNVIVHGWMSNPIPFIDKMDLVLVPSRWEEPFGRISVEAIYRNKFVLVSGRGGLPETVSFNERFIVRVERVDEWIKKIDELFLSGPASRESQAELFSVVVNFEIGKQVDLLKSFIIYEAGAG